VIQQPVPALATIGLKVAQKPKSVAATNFGRGSSTRPAMYRMGQVGRRRQMPQQRGLTMADKTKIEWSDATWNIITGCTLVDEGCRHCYAAHLITSWPAIGNHPSRKGLARKNAAGESKFTGEVRFNEQWLDQPLRWKKPRKIFVCAHGDLFHESVPDEWIDKVFAVMALAPQHVFQVLTKRPERARAYLSGLVAEFHAGPDNLNERFGEHCVQLSGDPCAAGWFEDEVNWPLPNVWLGTSVSDQASADLRIPQLLACPAAVRFVSAEPLLGPVDIGRWTATANVACKACGASFWLHDANPCLHDNHGNGWTLACPNCGGCRCKPAWTPADDRTIDMQPPQDWLDRSVGRFTKVHPTIEVKSGIDWVIVGGESGPHARPMNPQWARDIRDQCLAAGVAFHFKQNGEWVSVSEVAGPGEHFRFPDGRTVRRTGKKLAGRTLDGATWDQMPGFLG